MRERRGPYYIDQRWSPTQTIVISLILGMISGGLVAACIVGSVVERLQ